MAGASIKAVEPPDSSGSAALNRPHATAEAFPCSSRDRHRKSYLGSAIDRLPAPLSVSAVTRATQRPVKLDVLAGAA